MDEKLDKIVKELGPQGLLIRRDSQPDSVISLAPVSRLQALAEEYDTVAYPSYDLGRTDLNVKKMLKQVGKRSKKAHKIARSLLRGQTTLLGKAITLSRGEENGVIDLSKRYLRLQGENHESIGAILPYLETQFIRPLEDRFVEIRDDLKSGLFNLANYDPEKLATLERDIKRFKEKRDYFINHLGSPDVQNAITDFIAHVMYEDAFFVTKKSIDEASRRTRLESEEAIDLFYHGLLLKNELDVIEKSHHLLTSLHNKAERSIAFMGDALRSYEGISLIKSVSNTYRGMLETSVNLSFEMMRDCQKGQTEITNIESRAKNITRENLRKYFIN